MLDSVIAMRDSHSQINASGSVVSATDQPPADFESCGFCHMA